MKEINILKIATEVQISADEFYGLRIDLTENLNDNEFLKEVTVENTDITLILFLCVALMHARNFTSMISN